MVFLFLLRKKLISLNLFIEYFSKSEKEVSMILLQRGRNQLGFDMDFKQDGIGSDYERTIFIAESPVMKRLHKQIKLLANTNFPVLILGASGTGREKTAYEIFRNNKNKSKKKFFKLVCYDCDQKHIEEKLFGEKGLLYKGADSTLFIKGIECFGVSLQNRFVSFLLNSLNKETGPRLICASKDSFAEEVKEGRFSSNLFEILNQHILLLPSLSERVEDIPFFISYFNRENAFSGCFDEKALQMLMSHSWKGNIKELQSVCFQISILYRDKEVITENELVMIDRDEFYLLENIYYEPKLTLEQLVNHYIQLSLDHFRSKKRSAQALGISVKTIYNKIQKGHIAFSE